MTTFLLSLFLAGALLGYTPEYGPWEDQAVIIFLALNVDRSVF